MPTPLPPRMPPPPGLTGATGISPDPRGDLPATLRGEAPIPPSREPTIRASTWSERLADSVRDIHEKIAAFPLFQVTDKLGLTSIGDQAPYTDPNYKYQVATGDAPLPGGDAIERAVADLRPAALRGLGPAKWSRGTTGRYADAALKRRDAEHVMEALDNLREQFPSLKKSSPALERALKAEPVSPGTWAQGVYREPESGLILPTPDVMGRWARYGLYGEDIPANWGPLTQPGIGEAFGKDPREIKLYSDLWGAISPLNDPMVNTIQANRAFARTLGPQALSPMSEAEFNRLGLGLPSRRPNINRAMAGEPLSGPKVPRMSGMLQGNERLPPLDEHVTSASGGATGKWSEELPALRARVKKLLGGADEFKGDAGELRLNQVLSEGLVDMWGAMYPEREPLSSMASSWEGVRSDKGIKSVGGPYDILRRLGLGGRDAMLDPKKVGGAKWPGGYISSAVLAPLLYGLAQEPAPQSDPSTR